jgi:hypothetical protein
MGTRAGVGFRYKGQDWWMYHHNDGGPKWLGLTILRFCRGYVPDQMRQRVDQFLRVNEGVPTEAQVREVAPILGFSKEKVEKLLSKRKQVKGREDDRLSWDNLLADVSGAELELFMSSLRFWPDYDGFIYSFSCEWGYLINLDTNKLELYTSHYDAPDHERASSPRMKPKGRYADSVFDEDLGRNSRGGTLLDEIPLQDIREIPESALISFADRINRQH